MTLSRARPITTGPLAETVQEKPREPERSLRFPNGSFPIPGGASHKPLGEGGGLPIGSDSFVSTREWIGPFTPSGSGFIPHRTGLAEFGSGRRAKVGYGRKEIPGLTCGETTPAVGSIISGNGKAVLCSGITKAERSYVGR